VTKLSGGESALPHLQKASGKLHNLLDGFFQYSSRGSDLRTEILAGITTFSTLSYVLVVHPLILSASGMDRGALITVTALAAAIFTVIMGLRTNYPLAMAPGMGVNAFVAEQVCLGMHIPWQAALGMVFYSGILFMIVSLTGIRRRIIESFPASFKKTVGGGIGFFIAFLGLRNAKIVVPNARSIVSMGNFSSPVVWLGLLGILLTIILVLRKVPGALIISILLLTIAGLFLPGAALHSRITPLPHSLLSWPNSISPIFLKLDLAYSWRHPGQSIPIVLALFFSDLFSAMAVLLAIGSAAGLNDANGNLPLLKEALSADAAAASGGALLGTTTTIIYVESAAGVEQGGRTGLVSITCALCFLVALLLSPLIAVIPPVATTPALVMVGIFMIQGLNDLDLKDGIISATALITILLTLLASVSEGLVVGFITNIVLLVAVGRRREVKPIAYLLVVLFVLHYIWA
jgi:AGZA family xanthine/uracil permease-like MFS transporter